MSSLYYIAALVLSAVVIVNADEAASRYEALYQQLGPSEKTDTAVKSWLETLTLGLYRGGSEKQEALEHILQGARSRERKSETAAWALFLTSAAFLIAVAAVHRPRAAGGRARLARHLLGVSAIFLVVGLLTPVLSLIAYRDIPLVGNAVVKYESRGILSAVLALYRSGNGVVASLLLLFSVLAPLAKLALSFAAVQTGRSEVHRRCVRALQVIGNWSMTDVFVVAVILALFVMGAERATDSWPGVGLYFFASYSILALAAGHLIVRAGPDPG